MKPEVLYYIIAIMGVLFHLIMKFRDAFTKAPETSTIKEILALFHWQKQLVFAVFSSITALVLVFMRDYVFSIFAIEPEKLEPKILYALIFFLGYFADSVWKNTESTGASKYKVIDNNNDAKQ